MKAYQKIIREKQETSPVVPSLCLEIPRNISLDRTQVKRINYNTARTIILQYEWIGTMPLPKSCRYMYGLYFDGVLGGAIVYVEPSTRQFVKDLPRQVLQLNRGACIYWTPKNSASKLIAASLKDLKHEGIKLIIAYCTPEAGEVGTIYQALGWWYIGRTIPTKVYFLDKHWISERTLADKVRWAKSRNQAWQEKFANLPFKELLPKYKYIKILAKGVERKGIIEEYQFCSLPYPSRKCMEIEIEEKSCGIVADRCSQTVMELKV